MGVEQNAVDGLMPLPQDRRRRHMHYTHVRTTCLDDVQPHQLTREAFWQHLERCYREAYPSADSETGSILHFGVVCKEKHNDAARDVDRSEHHHAAVFCSVNHYWRKVRIISSEKYHVHLNAVAHDTYCTMYSYLRVPTAKKPLCELDSAPYHSPLHPTGDTLRELLAVGARYLNVRRKKPNGQRDPGVRSQFATAFNWIMDHDLRGRRGAVQLEIDAVKELSAGRGKLLEFVKKYRSCLEDQIEFCWSLKDAPQRMERIGKSRLDILLDAAIDSQSTCKNGHGHCDGTYNHILEHQDIAPSDFGHAMYTAFEQGRRKGNAVMVVGGRDTGKTTVTEPARLIFNSMQTPQSDSFCPLQNIRGHEVLLWQDFRFNPGHPRKDEQGLRIDEGTWNRLLEGLPTLIGVPKSDGSADFLYQEDAACIFTGPFELIAYRNGRVDVKETEQLACRMKYFTFGNSAPPRCDRSFNHCPLCWSRWILQGELQWRRKAGVEQGEFMDKVSQLLGSGAGGDIVMAADVHAGAPISSSVGGSSSSRDMMGTLQQLIQWRQSGSLTESEFANAKTKLGL